MNKRSPGKAKHGDNEALSKQQKLITPSWPAPDFIKVFCTTRYAFNGHSAAPFEQFNVGLHVGDVSEHVYQNRQQLPFNDVTWLEQVHGTHVIELPTKKIATKDLSIKESSIKPLPIKEHDLKADASFTRKSNIACVVMTADCLPILMCDRKGRWVAAIHAGWRGLADGIIEQSLLNIQNSYPDFFKAEDILVWLGPAIGANAFEVGQDVFNVFQDYSSAFSSTNNSGKYLCDIYAIAREKLLRKGIHQVFGGEYCTFSNPDLFYSFRRDGITGRMAAMICICDE